MLRSGRSVAQHLLAPVPFGQPSGSAASSAFQELFFRYFAFNLGLTIVLQLWAVVWLVGKKIPTMIDNAYRHLNKADNLRSLRRATA